MSFTEINANGPQTADATPAAPVADPAPAAPSDQPAPAPTAPAATAVPVGGGGGNGQTATPPALYRIALKAFVAAIIAGLSSLGTVLVGTNVGLGDVTSAQWVTIALATVVAFGGVYGVKNSPAA
jgi:hypothetical protein